jgi:hypothetical protein
MLLCVDVLTSGYDNAHISKAGVRIDLSKSYKEEKIISILQLKMPISIQ